MTYEELYRAFRAAWNIIQAAGEAEGIYFGERDDNILVARAAAEFGWPGAERDYRHLTDVGVDLDV